MQITRILHDVPVPEDEFHAGPHGFDDYFVDGGNAAAAPLCAALG